MKQVTEWEPSDIDLDKDDLHKKLSIIILGAAIVASGNRADPSDDKPVKAAVALVLTMLNKFGYVVSKKEEVPAVFQEGNDGTV